MSEFVTQYIVLGLHIPDGFLSLPVSALFWLISGAIVALAVRRTRDTLDERQVPLMGVMAACIFAAQMLNFPVAGGTSGHLLGGALAAIVLGPSAGTLVMCCVIALQALLFQDGGLVVMGGNIFDMGILTALVGGGVFYGLLGLLGRWRSGLVISGFIASLLSVLVAALVASLQLAVSGTARGAVVLPAMMAVHLPIAIGEGLITASALSFLLATRPDLLPASLLARIRGERRPVAARSLLGAGLAVAALLACLAPLASAAPDGLERVAIDLGFMDGDRGPGAVSPIGALPDYSLPGVGGGLSTILASMIGVLIVVALAYGVALMVRRRGPVRESAS